MKTFLIIGASSGIGLALATQLKEEGNRVIGTYNKNQEASQHLDIEWKHFDVLEEESLNLETDVLDGLVYCPGAINLKPFLRTKTKDFQDDFQLQVIGAVKVIQQVTPMLKKSKHASVILFSTVAVSNGFPFHSIVSASKGALEGLTKALAAEFSPAIRFNCIAPSLTNTPLSKTLLSTEDKIHANAQRHPLKAIGEAEDLAEMASFLLGDKSKWITGQIFAVDGGMSTLKV